MAGPFPSRSRSSSVSSDFGATTRPREPTLSSKPDHSRRGPLAFLFATKPERNRTPSPVPSANSSLLDVTEIPRRRRTNSRPSVLARTLTGRPRPLSRINASPSNSPTLPSIFASLPRGTRDRIRNSYDSTRRSSERPATFIQGDITPIPDIPDPETPTPNPHSFRVSETGIEREYKRRSMGSFARPPITSHSSARRISSFPLGDDLLDAVGESYRASTADLSDFLRDTGPEDMRPVHKSSNKDDQDGASSTRSRTKSSIFRIGGRRREKSRPSVGPGANSGDVPPVPLPYRQSGETRTSLSHILPLLNLDQEGANSSGTRSSLQSSFSGHLPPNTREHRLRDGTTILMITTPQVAQPRTLSYSRSLGSMTNLSKEEPSPAAPNGSDGIPPHPPSLKPYPDETKLKTHSPTMSVSSDGTLSTTERPRTISGDEALPLLPRIRALETKFGPRNSTPAHEVVSGTQNGYLQVHTPKTRPRGYSSPERMSPPSADSTPTVSTPKPSFSPSASIAPTPELTPQKSPLELPTVKVNGILARKSSLDSSPRKTPTDTSPLKIVTDSFHRKDQVDSSPRKVFTDSPSRKTPTDSPIIVDGLHFPAPPNEPPQPRRRPYTMEAKAKGNPTVSPSRASSKSVRLSRSPRNSNPSEADSIKARTRRTESRPRPLNLGPIPSYREFKANSAEVFIQPGELTGLELDLSAGSSELGRKRDSLMEQHQQLFLNANPFQTPPSPADPFLGPPLKGSVLPPPGGGPPAMPLPPSPRPLPELPMVSGSPISPRSIPLPPVDLRRISLHSQRSRYDSLMMRSPGSITPIPASPVASDAVHALNNVLTAQREQFDSMSQQLVAMLKSFEDEKRAYEQRIQELAASVAEKEAKAKEDERKIKGLEWLVGNLNLRAAAAAKGGNNSDSDSAQANNPDRRRSSFSGLGANDDVPVTPLPINRVFDPAERAKRTASMDDVLQNLVALSFGSHRSPSRIHEWAAKTVLEQD